MEERDCHARLLPQEKLDWIRSTQKEGHGVIMLGDGINDAAALACKFLPCIVLWRLMCDGSG